MTGDGDAPASEGLTARRAITELRVMWERDDQRDPDWLEALPVFPGWPDWQPVFAEDIRSLSGYCLDVQASYESLLRVCGDTTEKARRKMAALMRHVNAWHGDEWFYVSCKVQAVSKADEDEAWAMTVEAEATSSGIRSFDRDEAEEVLADEVRDELAAKGWAVSDSEWEAIQREWFQEFSLDTAYVPGTGVTPLPELPQSTGGVTFRYASQGDDAVDEGEILAVCQECGFAFSPEDRDDSDLHAMDCARFEERR